MRLHVTKAFVFALLFGAHIVGTGCQQERAGSADPVISVEGAEPQSTPIPTADANDTEVPQIASLDAPDTVRPGQVANLRLTTNYAAPLEIEGAALVIDGVEGWLKAEVTPEPAAASDAGAWLVTLPVAVAANADENDLAGLEVALLGPGDRAGVYRSWNPKLDTKGDPVQCPLDGDCTDLACGFDPICGTVCGTCDNGEACNADQVCEMIGAACPAAAACGSRECGPDLICGESCGECQPGAACSFSGTCEPDPTAPNVEVVELVAGASHVCARHVTGQVKCWGDHAYGQLGLGDVDRHGDEADEMGFFLPVVDLGEGRTATRLASGQDHNCAILDDDSVKCWGRNHRGQLGLGDTKTRGDDIDEMGEALPAVDLAFSGAPVDICAGAHHSCALSDAGELKCWGANDQGQLGQGDVDARGDQSGELGSALASIDVGGTPVAISCESRHVCARLDSDAVKCWGYNQDGQLGLEDSDARGDAPGEMGAALPAVPLNGGTLKVSARWSHSCSVIGTTLKCWGDNDSGGLGLGDTTPRGNVAGTMGASLDTVDLGGEVSDVAVGFGHTCATLADGRAKCWGFNGGGALGLGDTTARGDGPGEMGNNLPSVDLGADLSVVALALGNGFSCALLDGAQTPGQVKCWGTNVRGQLGQGDTRDRGDQADEMGDALDFVDLW